MGNDPMLGGQTTTGERPGSSPAAAGPPHAPGPSWTPVGRHVVGAARKEAASVAEEARRQTKDVLRQARTEASDQAASQQERIAKSLRSMGDEFGAMAARSDQQGVAADLARNAASTAGELASWLEQRDPAALLDEVRSFARKRPGTFLAIAAGAGVIAGRLTRGLAADSRQPDRERHADHLDAQAPHVSRAGGEGLQSQSPYPPVPVSDLAR
jgi:polyhydroxyalkanoate synthesis regulator phasin